MPHQGNLKPIELINFDITQIDLAPMFNNVMEQTRKNCDVPYAFIQIINSGNILVKAKIGFDEDVIPNHSIAAHVTQHCNFIQIADITTEESFEDKTSPLTSNQIRFYGSAPLISSTGYLLGYLVAMDTKAKLLDDVQISFLILLAQNATTQFELSKKNDQFDRILEIYELISETNPDIIFAKDKDFKIIHANSAFINLYPEENRDKILGYTTLENYKKEDIDVFLEQDKIAFEKGISEVIEKIAFPSGETKSLFTIKKRFKNAKGEDYILGIARDITENENLIDLLKKSNKDLDEFAHSASHDLKSPLNAIENLVDWIEEDTEGKLDEDSQEHFRLIKKRVSRMKRLVEDLLSYSKIERCGKEVHTLNLKSVVTDCLFLLNMPKEFTINTQAIDVLLPRIPLEMILTNLLSNAIKHHTKKNGRIDITCIEQADRYQLCIEDDGPGIDPKYHEKIFLRFNKLNSKDEIEGSGLGLSMVQKAINFYDGTIKIESEEGKGCKFIINWPKIDIPPNS
ncbi:GAF domain-containing sensor histidine kinase [Pseudocolwellia sp. HL-MZ19]|uniref:GAF domain-containing sensor histidine kinase n=1 Tax=unclassified Pseudocolwellia TaxID=2848178 RepID=UPI003CF3EAB1